MQLSKNPIVNNIMVVVLGIIFGVFVVLNILMISGDIYKNICKIPLYDEVVARCDILEKQRGELANEVDRLQDVLCIVSKQLDACQRGEARKLMVNKYDNKR
jgi:hypothetical protein